MFFVCCLTSSLILQPWRSATICPFGGLDLFPSIEALMKNGKSRSLQAIELESGIGHQWRLWKWASYCASEVNITTILSDDSITTLILESDMFHTKLASSLIDFILASFNLLDFICILFRRRIVFVMVFGSWCF